MCVRQSGPVYLECGAMDEATRVWESLGSKCDLVSQTAMMKAMVDRGDCDRALRVFEGMKTHHSQGATTKVDEVADLGQC